MKIGPFAATRNKEEKENHKALFYATILGCRHLEAVGKNGLGFIYD